MAIVYIATNLVNGKRYIGATTRSLMKRTREHKCAAKRQNSRDKDITFYRAIRKYGFKNFNFVVLIECEAEKVFFEEIRMISLLKPEYNRTTGGESCLGRRMSAFCRRRLAEGRKQNAKKIKKVLSALGKLPENKKRFQSYQHLGPQALARKVICIDDGLVYESASAAARQYGAAKSSVIELCLGKNGRKTVKGLRFMYYIGPIKEIA